MTGGAEAAAAAAAGGDLWHSNCTVSCWLDMEEVSEE